MFLLLLVTVISERKYELSTEEILLKNMFAVTLILILVILSSTSIWLYEQPIIQQNYDFGYKNGIKETYDPINHEAVSIHFNGTELQNFENIKSRLIVKNTDPLFLGNRTLQFISLRNSTSAPWDPYQKSMEYLCFWSGQGASGEWEAVISIYNEWGTLSDYVVEVSRFTWHSLEIIFDERVIASFPQVNNDTISPGYTTFHVKVESQ
jgi:hypothetical protein